MSSYDAYRTQVDDCFRNNRFTISMPAEERASIISKLRYPETSIELYQYRRCNEFSFNDFLQNKITLVHPKYFNDCFEVMPYINFEKFVGAFRQFDLETAKKYVEIANTRDFTPEEIKGMGGDNVAYILKDLANALKENHAEKNFYERFNEIQNYGMRQMASLLNQICHSKQNETRIACFSECHDSPIMWGHYADSGKGFCVQHSFPVMLNMSICPVDGKGKCEQSDSCIRENCIKSGNHWLLPVVYSSERPDFMESWAEQLTQERILLMGLDADLDNYDILSPLKFSCYKSSDWAYEHEWRWIRTLCSEEIPEFPSISVGKIRGLYLGEHISREHENILREYASKHKLPDGTNIPIYKMKNSFCTPQYKLLAERIM